MLDINQIVADAKTKEGWSGNGKYNYAPIKHLAKSIFNDGHDGIHFNLFYTNVSKVTDWETYLAYEFNRFDIRVPITDLFYLMGRTFPSINEDEIVKWVEENKSSQQMIVAF